MSFTFDPIKHEYRLGGIILPSVTQVLALVTGDYLARIPPAILERKRQIGTAVHAAIALDLNSDLDETTIDPAWAGYFEAWEKFKRDIELNPSEVGAGESPGYHPTYRYAGTPDLEIKLYNSYYGCKRWAIVDFKCTWGLHPAVRLQTAAYLAMRNAEKETQPLLDRYALHLHPDGRYKLELLDDKSDFSTFLACLALHRFKERHL